MAGAGADAAFGGVDRWLAWRFCCATATAAQVQQGELSDRVLGHRVVAPVCRAGFCFGVGVSEEGGGVFLTIVIPHIERPSSHRRSKLVVGEATP
jgi:hypothetical protein